MIYFYENFYSVVVRVVYHTDVLDTDHLYNEVVAFEGLLVVVKSDVFLDKALICHNPDMGLHIFLLVVHVDLEGLYFCTAGESNHHVDMEVVNDGLSVGLMVVVDIFFVMMVLLFESL